MKYSLNCARLQVLQSMTIIVGFVFVAALSAAESNISDQWYEAIRSGKTESVTHLLATGAPPSVADSRGATPLHYAAAVGTPAIMKILIAAGADVNARTAFGATPLLWSAASLEKVQLLVSHGAQVNARSKMGSTALTAAAAQAGNIETVQYLLDHGAFITEARNELGQTALLRAARANDLDAVRLLIQRGDDVKARDLVGFTPLMFASAEGSVEMMKLLIAKGADVNARLEPHVNTVKNGPIGIGSLSPLMFAVVSRNSAAVRSLLEAGADVNAKDIRGMTPLMLAIASDHAEPEIVRLLLGRKPDLAAKSDPGETASIWVAKFRTPAVLSLIQSPVTESAAQPVTTAADPALPPDVRAAAQKSVSLLQKATATFLRNGGCVSCHAQHITGMAVAAARTRGLRIDESAASDVLRATRVEFAARSDQFLERIDGPADVILTNALLALAAQSVPPDRMTDAMVRDIASQQEIDGYWTGIGIVRPPTSDWHISNTAVSIRVLRQYAPPALTGEMSHRIERALEWLKRTETATTEDAVMQLLGARWAEADPVTIERFARKVLALQRDDGGWAQTPQLDSDAYATGTALYALHEGGGIAPASPAYQRGVAFLLKTQAADGSWHVISRSPKFQPYFDGGFPYAHDQWISQWATGWASTALSLAIPDNSAEKISPHYSVK